MQALAAMFTGTVTPCGGTCVELLLTIVNDSGPPVGEAIIGNSSAGTVVTPGMPPPAGWQELGGKGSDSLCVTARETYHGAAGLASAVQTGGSLPYTSYQLQPEMACASHTNFWYWQVSTIDGEFIEDGAFSIDDTDSDSYFDPIDNCPALSNATQSDGDGDLAGDACDNCAAVSNADQADTDGDADGNVCDNCVSVPNADQADTDGDFAGDACEAAGSGNVDCDAAISPVDALKVLRHAAHLPVTQSEPCLNIGLVLATGRLHGDVDCNFFVNAVDALKILRVVAGLPVTIPPPCPPIEPP
jgi:hypothetical protein